MFWKAFLFATLISSSSFAFFTELGFNFSYKKTIVDAINYIEQQGGTASVSLYFWDQVATELSYTNSLYVKHEKADALPGSTTQRITSQYADIYGVDLIYVLAGKKATFQPYIKGGAAYLTKRQTVIQDTTTWTVPAISGWGPSYGVGFKIFITEEIAIRAGWDVVRTPIDSSTYADDLSGRVGISWIF